MHKLEEMFGDLDEDIERIKRALDGLEVPVEKAEEEFKRLGQILKQWTCEFGHVVADDYCKPCRNRKRRERRSGRSERWR